MTISAQRKILIGLVNDIPEEKLQLAIDTLNLNLLEPDENEPPLTEDEIRGITIGKKELADGKGIPLADILEPDEDEPPLTEDEIQGLAIADKEIAEGKIIPFDEVLKELW